MEELTHEKCIEILREDNTPRNIFLHTRKVNAIAVFLAKKFIEKGEKVDLYLVDMASMLHDMKKWEELQNERKEHHEITASKELKKRGYSKIASIVRKHGLDDVRDVDHLDSWEEIIVNYADKRVNNDEVVSVGGRMDYLKKRYGPISEQVMRKICSIEKPLEKLERKIFNKLDISPEDINEESIKPFLIGDDY